MACGTATLFDEDGPLFFMAFVPEPEDTVRIHIQFDDRISRRRIAAGLLDAYEKITQLLAKQGKTRIVFKSISPGLIGFFSRLGFEPCGDDDYELRMVTQ